MRPLKQIRRSAGADFCAEFGQRIGHRIADRRVEAAGPCAGGKHVPDGDAGRLYRGKARGVVHISFSGCPITAPTMRQNWFCGWA
jgi:hypothetical protein